MQPNWTELSKAIQETSTETQAIRGKTLVAIKPERAKPSVLRSVSDGIHPAPALDYLRYKKA